MLCALTNENHGSLDLKRFRWIFSLSIVLLLSFATIALPAFGQDELQNALRKALAVLGEKLGRPITAVDAYTYESITFTNESLDCPQEGQTYSQDEVRGYKFALTVSGTSYDVRVSADAKTGLVCVDKASDPTVPENTGLVNFRGAQFSIPYPDTWQSVDRQIDQFFGESNAPACAQPGMIVNVIDPVVDKTPDTLLDEYAKSSNLTGAQFQPERINVGPNGRSTIYTSLCTNGTSRQSRVTVFVAYGRGFRVWQYAPEKDFPQWADIFQKILEGFSPAAASATGNVVTFPNRTPLSYIAHEFAGNIYVGTLTDIPGTPITTDAASDRVYRNPVISLDGKSVAFVDPSSSTLFVSSVTQAAPHKIAENIVANYPPAWSTDNSEIAYFVSNGSKYKVMAAKADGSGSRQIGETLDVKTNCSATTSDPAEQLYWSTTGAGGNELALVWSASGTLYFSPGCDGLGLAQISGNGSLKTVIDEKLRRFKMSPDGKQVLGLLDESLVVLNLSDGKMTDITTAEPPDQLAWSPDGKTIYYSTATLKNRLTLDDEAQRERGTKAFGVWPFQAFTNEVALHSLVLDSKEDKKLYSTLDYAVVDIKPSPDQSGLLFTLIQDSANLVEAFQNNVSAADLRREAPTTLLYWLPLPTGVAQVIAVTVNPTWGPLGSAPEPTPTGDPKNKPTFAPQPKATVVPVTATVAG